MSVSPHSSSLVGFLYEIAQLTQPVVEHFDDPVAFKLAVDQLKHEKVSTVNARVTAAVHDRIAAPTIERIRMQLSPELYADRMKTHWFPLQRKWVNGVKHLVGERFGILSGTWSNHPDSSDLAWMNYVRSFDQVEKPSLTEFYADLLTKDPLTGSYLTETKALILNAPSTLNTDHFHRPHAEEGFAISYGTIGICAWKGLLIPDRYVLNKADITREDILSQSNVELRRALLEILGAETFSRLLNLETIDQSIDAQGNLQSLYRTKEKDNIIHDHLYFAHVVCPSTQRNYYLPVPPHLSTAHEAVAWTFGLEGDAYNPQIET